MKKWYHDRYGDKNEYEPIDYERAFANLNIKLKLEGPVLEDEGMRVFEYWGGEYHPLGELIEQMAEIKKTIRKGKNAASDTSADGLDGNGGSDN